MGVFALELDDRALSLARDGRILTSAPSAIRVNSAGQAWHELRSRPRDISTRHLGALLSQRGPMSRVADSLAEAELQRRLADQSPADTDRLWIVTPARCEPSGLAALLGVMRRMGLSVHGFIDSATIAAASTDARRNSIVLELGLHHTGGTAVDRDAIQTRRRHTALSERGGLLELYQAWLELVGNTMVKRTRFDPLHDAATEQQLFDALPKLATQASDTGATIATVSRGNQQFEVTLTRDQFAQAAEPIYRSMIGLLHQLRPAGTPVTIIIPRAAARLPGLREQLDRFNDCELVSTTDGFGALAASLLELQEPPASTDSVRLLRRIPIQSKAALGADLTRQPLGQLRSADPPPSHVLWDGRAYSLSAESVVVGRGASDSARHLTLPDGLAGVSRRHCTFVQDGDHVILLDHSSYGTYVNNERVLERVRIYAGDRIRLGDPGIELALIAVGDVPANPEVV